MECTRVKMFLFIYIGVETMHYKRSVLCVMWWENLLHIFINTSKHDNVKTRGELGEKFGLKMKLKKKKNSFCLSNVFMCLFNLLMS